MFGLRKTTNPFVILKREKLKANVIRFIRNIKHSIYDNKHGLYSGTEIVMKFKWFERQIKKLEIKICHEK